MRYNLVVLGGGPAGYTGAIRAAKRGMKVALAESGEVGGTCLNRGCIPTKCLLHSSELFRSRGEWETLGITGADFSALRFDQNRVYERKDAVVNGLRDGVKGLLRSCGVDVYEGKGRLTSAHSVEVNGEMLEADFVLIATGSRPALPPVKGIEKALTSDEVLARPLDASSVVVIGGGVIGAELACYFAGVGKKVSIIEFAERILPSVSKDISLQLSSSLKKSGVEIFVASEVTEVTDSRVLFRNASGEHEAECDAAVVAVGRRANVEDIGLESVGVEFDRTVKVDENMRTSVPNVYAAGDVADGIQLAHYASAAAIRAVEDMCGTDCKPDMSVVPALIYTQPEIASVGKTTECTKSGKFLLGANGKSLINGTNRGFIRVFCDDKDVIVGAELFGNGVTEIVGELALAVKEGLSAESVAQTIHAHPTVYESVAEACEDVFGLATHKK